MQILHQPCEKCGSSDALTIYKDEVGKPDHEHCFSCGHHQLLSHVRRGDEVEEYIEKVLNSPITPSGRQIMIRDRNISADTLKKYGTFVELDGLSTEIVKHYYPYYNNKSEHVANKVRIVKNKEFYAEGNLSECILFGQQLFSPKDSKCITICEGELDAMSGFEMTGGRYPYVSVKNGAQSAKNEIKKQLEYLSQFEKVILCFDMDEPGRKATQEVAQLFRPSQCYIMELDEGFKDANDYLKAEKADRFTKLWFGAKMYTPAEIIASSKLISNVMNNATIKPLIEYPFRGMNEHLFGIKPEELILISADTGVGKSQFLKEIIYYIRTHQPKAKIGTIFLEETPTRLAISLVSLHLNKRIHLPTVIVTPEEKQAALDFMFGDDNVYFYDSYSDNNIERIMSRLRYMIKGLDCDYIFLDHISQITLDAVLDNNTSERRLLDTIATRINNMVIETRCPIIAVAHENRDGLIRGSAGPEKVAHTLLRLERDKLSDDKNKASLVKVVATKNRNGDGELGTLCTLRFDRNTGHLEEVDTMPDIDVEI